MTKFVAEYGANRCRVRDLGIDIGRFEPGRFNAITDVPGVRVGHVSLIRGEGPLRLGEGPVRTGVTAILPPGDDWFGQPVEAACFIFNGAGTTTGLSLIDEYARLETPIILTNTLSVGAAYEGVVRYMVERIFRFRPEVPWFSPVVGETCDGYLNDIGGLHVRPEHVIAAIDAATDGSVAEGNVGAGTGTGALGFKAGIGTSSRVLEVAGIRCTLGAMVQSNFDGHLVIKGVPLADLQAPRQPSVGEGHSIMIVLATDLPISARLLGRLARRAVFGLARTGSNAGHGSGDYVIAFSSTYRCADIMPEAREALSLDEGIIDPVFRAAMDVTEEAILNSLFRAERMVGRDGHVLEALPIDAVVAAIKRR
jgi:D-aminopeptidase